MRYRSDEIALNAKPDWRELSIGGTAMVFWIFLLLIGAMVPSSPYRAALVASAVNRMSYPEPDKPKQWTVSISSSLALQTGRDTTAEPTTQPAVSRRALDNLSEPLSVWALIICLFTFSATNLFFLSVFAAHLGAMALRYNSGFRPSETNQILVQWEVRRFYTAAFMRGFLIYAVILSGSLVFGTEHTFNDVSQGQYLKLAGVISSIAFLAGYEPFLFRSVVDVLRQQAVHQQQSQDAQPPKIAPANESASD